MSLSVQSNPLLFFGNSFQLRYVLYVSLLMLVVTKKDLTHFYWGLYLGIGFLILESAIYSFAFEREHLTSGNFGTNTFGVLLGVLLIYVLSKKEITAWIKTPLTCVMLLAIVLTGTRSALFGLVLTLILTKLIIRFGFIRIAVMAGTIFLGLLFNYYNFLVDFFYPFTLLIDSDYAYLVSQNLTGGKFSSLLTRVSLWISSLNMIYEFPLGIGTSNFNFLKAEYGFDMPVFIDPHNDYLNFLIQYGVIGGLFFVILIFVYPVMICQRLKVYGERITFTQMIIFSFLTSITNSNFNKHQFFFIFIFILFVSLPKASSYQFVRSNRGH